MKILILGANGFLGQAIQKNFRSQNIDFLTCDKNGKCDFLGDLSKKEFVMNLPNVDLLINCAAVQYVTPKKPFLFKRNFFYTNNVTSLSNLFLRYGEHSETHLIHIGTSMMFDQNNSDRYFADGRLKASGIYSETKILGQEIVEKFKKNTTIVPCIIAGKGRGGLFKNFVLSMKYFNVALLIGTGKHKISLVHVDDVASIVTKVIDSQHFGILNVATNGAMTILDWIEIIADELEIKKYTVIKVPLSIAKLVSKITNYNLLAKEQLSMLEMPHVLDIEESKKIGWIPHYSSEDIIKETAKFYNRG